MKILIVAATPPETALLSSLVAANSDVSILTTGVGVPNTIYHLTKHILSRRPSLVLNIGICGAFSGQHEIGSCVHLDEEIFGDLGATDKNGNLLNFESLGFTLSMDSDEGVFHTLKNPNRLDDYFTRMPEIQYGKGLTVNTVSGDESLIRQRLNWRADFENMEGAGVAYVCRQEFIPYFEFRAISNYVEPRDKSRWNVPLAVESIQKFTIELIGRLKS